MKGQITRRGALACGLAFASGATRAAAQDVAEAFRNKTVRILIPTGPGGDRSLYTLPFAAVYGKHIPGNPMVVPVFMPGAGGSIALNNLYSVAAPNGLTIATPLTSVLSAQLTGEASVNYDARRFKWIGRIADATRVLIVSSKVKARTIEDLRNEEVVVGAVGQASETYSNAAFMNRVFGTKFKIIAGYGAAGKMMLAMATGETQGAFTTWNSVRSTHADSIRVGAARILLQIALAKHPDLPNVPLLLEMTEGEVDRQLVTLRSSASQMGQSFAAPPDTPPAIVQALRRAFDATMKDADLVEKFRSADIQFNPLTGEDLTEAATQVIATPAAIVDRYKAAVSGT